MTSKRLAFIATVWAALSACGQGRVTAQPEGPPRIPPPSWTAPAYDAAFGERWFDGKAELAGYALTYPRYGELRRGTAVSIVVTERLDPQTRIKAERDPGRGVPVIKLNLIEDFQTGVYDYNLMTSAFVTTAESSTLGAAGLPVKVSFSSQEWCGQSFSMARFEPSRVSLAVHSYFEGEGDTEQGLSRPADGIAEDQLLLWARGLAGPVLEPGESRTVPLFRSLAITRLAHVPPAWDEVTLSRAAAPESVEVPAGTFEADRMTARIQSERAPRTYGGGSADSLSREWMFWVEREGDRRVLRYARDDGLDAKLLASDRLVYWQLHDEGDESYLERLGLAGGSRATPRRTVT